MVEIFELKDINFSSFTDKLKAFYEKFYIKKLNITDHKIFFLVANPVFGLGVSVEIEKIDDRSFYWSFDQSSIIGLIITIWLILLFILKNNLIVYMAACGITGALVYTVSYQQVKKFLPKLFTQIASEPLEQQSKKANTSLVCPACGEPLTEYDEFCPSCGLYLGKSYKKQPVHRTGLFNFRLTYNYREKKRN